MGLEKIPGIKIPKTSKAVLVAGSDTTIYNVTSGRIFYLEAIAATAKSGYAPLITIYDSPSTNNVKPVVPIGIRAGDTIYIGKDVFNGVPEFRSGVVAVADTSGVAWLQVIGYEV